MTGDVYCDGVCSRAAGGGPPSMEEMDMLLPAVLGGLPKEFSDGSSRPDGKAVGCPTLAGGARGGGGP